ncbi:MAG TPA: hypothetical protein VLH60_05350 [Sedimentisphaerales bacterium]|nr:hypothetical protein [Sedimentisphaerales bacterium]
MKKIIRPIAVPAAVLVFFVMAGVGVYREVPPHTAAVRAAIGAAVIYVVVSFTVKVFVNVMVDSMVRKKMSEMNGINRTMTNE